MQQYACISHAHCENYRNWFVVDIPTMCPIPFCPNVRYLLFYPRYVSDNAISVVEGLEQCQQLTELHIANQRLPEGDKLHFDPRSLQAIAVRCNQTQRNCNFLPLGCFEHQSCKLRVTIVKSDSYVHVCTCSLLVGILYTCVLYKVGKAVCVHMLCVFMCVHV